MRVINMLTTYNEKDNIDPMIKTLEKIAKENPKYEFINLIVDSHSPDGTGEIVKKMAEERRNLFLLETPRGLGISLIQGYKFSMEKLKGDVIIPNDCDFQWDPNLIPIMLEKIKQGCDVVVPSRHVKGGKDNFNAFRKLTHFISNDLLNYYWAGIREVKDLAGNFKAIRVKGVLEKVNFNCLNVRGFVIQSTMIYELSKTGAKFIEIPAIYGERRAGQAKVGFNKQFIKDIFETIKNSSRIRFERSPGLLRFIKFGTIGGFGFLINFIGFRLFKILFKSLPLDISFINSISNAIAAEIAIISNFIFNNLWTFAQEKITLPKKWLAKLIQFNFSSVLSGIIIPSSIIGILTKLFGDKYSSLYFVIAIFGVTVPLNWFIYNRFIWGKKKIA